MLMVFKPFNSQDSIGEGLGFGSPASDISPLPQFPTCRMPYFCSSIVITYNELSDFYNFTDINFERGNMEEINII